MHITPSRVVQKIKKFFCDRARNIRGVKKWGLPYKFSCDIQQYPLHKKGKIKVSEGYVVYIGEPQEEIVEELIITEKDQ